MDFKPLLIPPKITEYRRSISVQYESAKREESLLVIDHFDITLPKIGSVMRHKKQNRQLNKLDIFHGGR
jgi:hypothetical protein